VIIRIDHNQLVYIGCEWSSKIEPPLVSILCVNFLIYFVKKEARKACTPWSYI